MKLRFLQAYDIDTQLYELLKDSSSVLDVGCGRCSLLKDIKEAGMSIRSVGMDFYTPYVEKAREKGIHNDYVIHDIRKTFPFKDKEFGVAIAIEVIEHLKKEDSYNLLKEMERVAQNCVIITTPNGFLEGVPGAEDNPEESHLSGWTAKELRKLGFNVYGSNGLKFLRGNAGEIKLRPKKLFKIISAASRPFTYRFPSLAFQLFGYKVLKK